MGKTTWYCALGTHSSRCNSSDDGVYTFIQGHNGSAPENLIEHRISMAESGQYHAPG